VKREELAALEREQPVISTKLLTGRTIAPPAPARRTRGASAPLASILGVVMFWEPAPSSRGRVVMNPTDATPGSAFRRSMNAY